MNTTLTPLDDKDVHPHLGCMDCGKICDMYKVKDEIWEAAVPEQHEIQQQNRLMLRTWREDFQEERRRHPRKEEVTNFKRKHWKYCVLCFNCLELRLGRHFVLDDFTDDPINRPIILGYALRMQETGHWK